MGSSSNGVGDDSERSVISFMWWVPGFNSSHFSLFKPLLTPTHLLLHHNLFFCILFIHYTHTAPWTKGHITQRSSLALELFIILPRVPNILQLMISLSMALVPSPLHTLTPVCTLPHLQHQYSKTMMDSATLFFHIPTRQRHQDTAETKIGYVYIRTFLFSFII